MNKRLYVGGLPFKMDSEALKELFQKACGDDAVDRAEVISHRDTGQSRGFGFVDMASPEEASKAIRELHDKMVEGGDGQPRRIKVSEAENRSSGGDRRGGFGGRRSGYGSDSSYGDRGSRYGDNHRGRRDDDSY